MTLEGPMVLDPRIVQAAALGNIDIEFLEALPSELRAEVLAAHGVELPPGVNPDNGFMVPAAGVAGDAAPGPGAEEEEEEAAPPAPVSLSPGSVPPQQAASAVPAELNQAPADAGGPSGTQAPMDTGAGAFALSAGASVRGLVVALVDSVAHLL
jgi:hypothetical protein